MPSITPCPIPNSSRLCPHRSLGLSQQRTGKSYADLWWYLKKKWAIKLRRSNGEVWGKQTHDQWRESKKMMKKSWRKFPRHSPRKRVPSPSLERWLSSPCLPRVRTCTGVLYLLPQNPQQPHRAVCTCSRIRPLKMRQFTDLQGYSTTIDGWGALIEIRRLREIRMTCSDML